METLTGGGVPSSAAGAGVSAGFCSSATAPSPSNGKKQQEGKGGDAAPASRCVSRGPLDRARGAITHAMRWFDQSVLFRETTNESRWLAASLVGLSCRVGGEGRLADQRAARVSRVRRQMTALAREFLPVRTAHSFPGRGDVSVRSRACRRRARRSPAR